MKSFLLFIGRLWSYIVNTKVIYNWQAVQRYFYTEYYAGKFKSFGENSIIKPAFLNVCGLEYITIGNDCTIGEWVELTAWNEYKGDRFHPKITIGNGCTIRTRSHITAINSITIGDNLLTGQDVLITDNAHGQFDFVQLQLRPQDLRYTVKVQLPLVIMCGWASVRWLCSALLLVTELLLRQEV